MSPLFTDDRDDAVSASEGTTEGREAAGNRTGTKRRLKNRDAARKSRKKQTQKADELHQELLSLEGSNAALEKEIKALKKEARRYTAALENHRPFCVLRGPDVALGPSASGPGPDGEASRLSPPSSDFSHSALFSLDPHSLFGRETESAHLPSSSFSAFLPEEFLSVTSGPLRPDSIREEGGDWKSMGATSPAPLPVPPGASEELWAPNGAWTEPGPGEPSLSELLEGNEWILSGPGSHTPL
ncbi:fos-related antigen 1-like [Syngnathoides biaculeatus]|uniref:fos-related antigen 1-like n=1 Tax=Syngnathoides biaculeatus TaxID=300417 RepID=UPI002ADD3950|nr:fos-related antigen 1-like [Syngnathoides biaculeatus]